MPRFLSGLFDRWDSDDGDGESPSPWKQSITRDLEALLNTRSALLPSRLVPYPEVAASVLNYGLIDFAGMCMSSHADQWRICEAVRSAITCHEPRLSKVSVTLRPGKNAINRVDFVISAQVRNAGAGEPLHFNAVFRPSLQQYSVHTMRATT